MEAPLDPPSGVGPTPISTSSAAQPASMRGVMLLACCLFVLSGACGLAYEVVWTKYLGLFLGNTVLLHTAVLGTFMGGLALGSLLIGRRVARIAAPLKAYGWLELLVAAYAFNFPALARLGQGVVAAAAAGFGSGSLALLLVKVLTGAALLLLPTLLMGATLPLLTAHVERVLAQQGATERRRRAGDGANWLYFANCAGAVLGTLVTGFFLIPQLGLGSTVMGVALLNALVGLLAVGTGNAAGRVAASGPAEPQAKPTATLRREERMVLVAICLSGATAFLYELVWTRLFAVALGSSTYSFTLMLAAFITGLALGSIAANLLPVRRGPLLWLAGAEAAIGITIALSLMLYPRVPYWCWQWRWLLRAAPESLDVYHLCQYGLIFLVMAVPTFLFGLTFPTAIRAASDAGDAGEGVAGRAALVYGWNTLGTLVGVALAGGVLIPLLGLQRTLQVGAAVNLGIALWLLLSTTRERRHLRASAIPLALGFAALLLAPRWQAGTFTYGQYRANVPAPPSYQAYQRALLARKPLFYREDFGTTVAVLETESDTPGQKQNVLVVDGKADATSIDDMPTQKLLGHVPMFLKPDAKEVFVLGLGSGATAGSLLAHPGVEHVDCVELSSAVVKAAELFGDATNHPMQDPRMHLAVDDGKTFLAASRPGRYDLIISQPTNPWIAGVGSLFSEESYRAAARALKDDGLVAQWFHTYALDDELVATIIRTYRRVFPYAVLFQGHQNDYILVGSKRPLHVSFSRMERELGYASVRADLESIHLTSVAALLSRQTHSVAALQELEAGGGINTDDLPLLEYLAPAALYVGANAEKVRTTDGRLRPGSGLALAAYLEKKGLSQADYRSIIDNQSDPRMGNRVLLTRLLRDYLRRWPEDAGASRQLAALLLADGERFGAITLLNRAAQRGDLQSKDAAARIRATAQAESVTVLSTLR